MDRSSAKTSCTCVNTIGGISKDEVKRFRVKNRQERQEITVTYLQVGDHRSVHRHELALDEGSSRFLFFLLVDESESLLGVSRGGDVRVVEVFDDRPGTGDVGGGSGDVVAGWGLRNDLGRGGAEGLRGVALRAHLMKVRKCLSLVAPVQRLSVDVLVEFGFETSDLVEVVAERRDGYLSGTNHGVAAVELQVHREGLVVEELDRLQTTFADGEYPLLSVLPHDRRVQEADVADRLNEFVERFLFDLGALPSADFDGGEGDDLHMRSIV